MQDTGTTPAGSSAAHLDVEIDRRLAAFIEQGGLQRFPYPKVAIQIGNALLRFNFMLGPVAHMVERDPGLAAAVLKKANCAANARGGVCTSVKDAVTRIGAKQLGGLIAAARFGFHLSIDGPLLSLRRLAWREAITAALLCDALAEGRRLSGASAFLCGLQHDIGKTLTLACLESIAAAWPDMPAMPASYWKAVIERHHIAVGLAVSKLWDLPPNVQAVIEHHHRPEGIADTETRRLADLVAVADALNALLVETRAITPELIAGMPGVGNRQEVAVLAELIASLPGYLSDLSLKAVAERKTGKMRSLVLPEPATRCQVSPKPLSLSCHLGGLSVRCQTTHFTDDELLISCGRALEVEFVFRFTSVEDPTQAFWALVCECQPSGSGYALRLRPFATDQSQYDQFRCLLG